MNEHGDFDRLESYEPFSGVLAAAFTTERATITRYDFEPGAGFPLHHHPQEQIVLVEQGEVEFTVDGKPQQLVPGSWSVVGSNVVHGLRAGEAGGRIYCIVSPPRERADEYEVEGAA